MSSTKALLCMDKCHYFDKDDNAFQYTTKCPKAHYPCLDKRTRDKLFQSTMCWSIDEIHISLIDFQFSFISRYQYLTNHAHAIFAKCVKFAKLHRISEIFKFSCQKQNQRGEF